MSIRGYLQKAPGSNDVREISNNLIRFLEDSELEKTAKSRKIQIDVLIFKKHMVEESLLLIQDIV